MDANYFADLDQRCSEFCLAHHAEAATVRTLCGGCGAPVIMRGDEIGRLNGLVGEIRSLWLVGRIGDRIDELEAWERVPEGRCYLCGFEFRQASSEYWREAERAHQADLAKRKRLIEES